MAVPEPIKERWRVNEDMVLKNENEEDAEVGEHLSQVVPEDANIRYHRNIQFEQGDTDKKKEEEGYAGDPRP